jgi:hypothetical protein
VTSLLEAHAELKQDAPAPPPILGLEDFEFFFHVVRLTGPEELIETRSPEATHATQRSVAGPTVTTTAVNRPRRVGTPCLVRRYLQSGWESMHHMSKIGVF